MSKMKPTKEQEDIIKVFGSTRVLKINAVAGSGKTSTLEMLANEYEKPSLYMAFNKGIAEEAKGRFPAHVFCRTIHSLAFAGFGRGIVRVNACEHEYKEIARKALEENS